MLQFQTPFLSIRFFCSTRPVYQCRRIVWRTRASSWGGFISTHASFFELIVRYEKMQRVEVSERAQEKEHSNSEKKTAQANVIIRHKSNILSVYVTCQRKHIARSFLFAFTYPPPYHPAFGRHPLQGSLWIAPNSWSNGASVGRWGEWNGKIKGKVNQCGTNERR